MRKLLAMILCAVMCATGVCTAFAAAPLEGYPGIEELPAMNTIPNPFQFRNPANDPTGDG